MYTGLPVVAVRATGVSSLVRDKETGFLVSEDSWKFSQAVIKLIEEIDLRLMFSQKSKELAQAQYTAKASGAKMEKLYEKLLRNKKNNLTI